MRLKYWFRSGFQAIGIVVLFSVVLLQFLYIWLFRDTDDDLSLLLFFPLLFSPMMFALMTMGLYKLNVPLAISLGSTRGEVLLGLQVFRLIPTVLAIVLMAVLHVVSGADALLPVSAMIPLSLGIFLIAVALGSLTGICFAKWGEPALAVILVGFFVSFVAFAIFDTCFAANSFDENWLRILNKDGLGLAVFGIGLMVYSLMLIPESRTVWKCNVKL